MPVLAYVLVPLLVVLGGLGLFAARDLIAGQLIRPRLPGRSIGALPPSAVTLNGRGKWQLRTATILMAELSIQTEEILAEKTAQLIDAWLEDCERESADEARLLDSASLVLLRVEHEENILESMSEERKARLAAWLDDYLNRRKEEE